MKFSFGKIVLPVLFATTLALGGHTPVHAADEMFSVKKTTHPAETNTSHSSDWYELNSDSLEGKTTQFKFVLTNPSPNDKLITIESRSAFAQTNQLLDVTYPYRPNTDASHIMDPTRVFERYTPKLPTQVTVPANSAKEVALEMNVPTFEGEILGAFAFKEVKKDSSTTDSDEENLETSISVQNEYVIAVHLKSDKPKEDSFLFSDAKATSDSSTFGVTFNVENPNPNLASFPVNFSVQNEKGEVVLKNEKPMKFKMPPNSKTYFQIPWSDGKIKTGEYTLSINGEKLPFKIESEDMKKAELDLGENHTTLVNDVNWLLIALIIALLIPNLFFVFFFIRNKRKNNKQ